MVTCQKCGEKNPLGHVFCKKCGNKLDLSAMTSDNVARVTKPNWFKRYSMELIGLPVVLVALAIILAIWPRTDLVGEKGTLIGAKRVENALLAFGSVKPGQTMGALQSFSEKDINGYFEYVQAPKLHATSVSVVIGDGYVRARVIRTLFSMVIWKIRFSPKSSVEWVCVPVEGRLAVVKGSIGHLPMAGPGKGIMAGKLAALFASQREWAGLSYVKDVKLQTGTAGLVVGR